MLKVIPKKYCIPLFCLINFQSHSQHQIAVKQSGVIEGMMISSEKVRLFKRIIKFKIIQIIGVRTTVNYMVTETSEHFLKIKILEEYSIELNHKIVARFLVSKYENGVLYDDFESDPSDFKFYGKNKKKIIELNFYKLVN